MPCQRDKTDTNCFLSFRMCTHGVCKGEEDQDDELSLIVAGKRVQFSQQKRISRHQEREVTEGGVELPEANFLDLSINDGHSGELGGFLANLADCTMSGDERA